MERTWDQPVNDDNGLGTGLPTMDLHGESTRATQASPLRLFAFLV
jgi:hypothetical protein